jgi:hypothetical protein
LTCTGIEQRQDNVLGFPGLFMAIIISHLLPFGIRFYALDFPDLIMTQLFHNKMKVGEVQNSLNQKVMLDLFLSSKEDLFPARLPTGKQENYRHIIFGQ